MSHINRGASVLVVLGVLLGGLLSYAQSSSAPNFYVGVYKDPVRPMEGALVRQIYAAPTGGTYSACTTASNGGCALSDVAETDVYFEAELDGVFYGGLADYDQKCKKTTYKYDVAEKKVKKYTEGLGVNAITPRINLIHSGYYPFDCVKNSKGGYDPVEKKADTTSLLSSTNDPVMLISPPPSILLPIPKDDFEDVEDEESADVDIDIKLVNVVLGSKKLQKQKSTAALGLKFKIAAASNALDTVIFSTSMDCTLRSDYPNEELWQSWNFKMVKSGSQQVFYEFGAEDVKWAALKKKNPFMCYAAVNGIVPVDAPLELRQDADAFNNRLRFKLSWKGGRWQISKPEAY